MAVYAYKAVRQNGEVLEGEMEAADQAALLRKLQEDGLIPIKTGLAGGGRFAALGFVRGRTKPAVKQEQVLNFTRELATLLEAGLTLDRALQVLIELSDDEQLVHVMDKKKSVKD